MTVQTGSSKRSAASSSASAQKRPAPQPAPETRPGGFFRRFIPLWLGLFIMAVYFMPSLLSIVLGSPGYYVVLPYGAQPIAPLFTEEIDYWAEDIHAWAAQYSLDPNLLATVMQIESCGHADVSSVAGAQGLFQVMPFHFAPGEAFTDPDTNAMRSASVLQECSGWADGDAGLTLACYNGGPSVIQRDFMNWPDETRRYYLWGRDIYADATHNRSDSETLQSWLTAGGRYLCDQAAANIGLETAS